MWKGRSLNLYCGKHSVTILQDCIQVPTYTDQEREGTVHSALEWDFGQVLVVGGGEVY
jgi:hypothetical protein